jgi:pyruvate formate lyase activating enzyme
VNQKRGIIFDIHHYAVYDGPGIRTTVFFKGCPLRCVWCHNPESQKMNPEISYFRDRCERCGSCIESCPHDAIRMEDWVIRDDERCAVCARCVEVCPHGAMELIGREISSEEIVAIVSRDKPYYDNSDGGVTISGGEPTAQKDFLLAVLTGLKEKEIHTAVETCGSFSEEFIDPLLPLVDLFLFDIKHIDSHMHKRFTGVSNERILSNYSEIVRRSGSERILPRIPLIPEFNVDPRSIDDIISFLKEVRYEGPVHLMPYNRMAKTKYEKLGRGDAYRDMGEQTDEDVSIIIEQFAKEYSVVCNQ